MSRACQVTLLVVWLGTVGVPASALASHSAQHRYLSEQKNRVDTPARYEPLTFTEFLALPAPPEAYTTSDWDTVRAQTQRGVSLEGYIAEVIRAGDGATYGRPPGQGDFHVHLREARQPRCAPEGPRDQQIVTEVTPHFQPPRTGWSYAALLDLCQRQVRVRLSGWLLHDYQHVKGIGDWRASTWEIHPVTNVEVWDAARDEWQQVR